VRALNRITNRCLPAKESDTNCHSLKCLSIKRCHRVSSSNLTIALKKGIEMQIEIIVVAFSHSREGSSVYNLNICNIPMLWSSGSLSISSSIVAIVKLDADVNQMSSNLLKS
jgi:hypothetical protein